MFIIQWTLFISNSQELRARGCLRETVCALYDFMGEMIFLLESLQHEFLKSVRVSERIISLKFIRNKNKHFGKRVSRKYLKC